MHGDRLAFSLARPHRMYWASNHIIPAISFFNLPFPLFCFTQGPVLAQPGVGYFHTRRPLNAHAKTPTPKAYADNTLIARPSEAYIVCIDMFTTPVATLACRSKHTSLYKPTKKKGGMRMHAPGGKRPARFGLSLRVAAVPASDWAQTSSSQSLHDRAVREGKRIPHYRCLCRPRRSCGIHSADGGL